MDNLRSPEGREAGGREDSVCVGGGGIPAEGTAWGRGGGICVRVRESAAVQGGTVENEGEKLAFDFGGGGEGCRQL